MLAVPYRVEADRVLRCGERWFGLAGRRNEALPKGVRGKLALPPANPLLPSKPDPVPTGRSPFRSWRNARALL